MRPPRVRAADDEGDGDIRPAPSARRALRDAWWFPVLAAMLFASVLHLLWLWLVASGGGDLAAQDAWAEFVGRHPDSAYNLAWYGGMHPVSYSVISPYLMAVIGVRPVLILSGVISAGLLALILVRARGLRRPMVPALCGALTFACNAASGRVTFALGTMFALVVIALLWAWPRRWGRRPVLRGVLVGLTSALATAGSPVSGLFLLVVAAALLLRKRWAVACAVGLPPPIMVGLSTLLFPFSGEMPMPWVSVFFPLSSAIGVRLLAPTSWWTVRRCAEIYGLGIVLTWAIPSQIGLNVERLGLMFGTVVLVALIPTVTAQRSRRRGIALIVALLLAAGFQIGKPTWDVIHTTPEAAWAHDLAPLVHQLDKRDADRGRVEVVPVESHREASAIAPYVNLARGWSRQADTGRNPLFYEEGGLSPKRYHEWLRRWAVRFVVLSSDEPDIAARDEARIVRSGQPYLRKVWSDPNWTLYRVNDPMPLASPPAEGARADPGEVTVKVRHAGEVLVRIPWSPWLGLVNEDGERIKPPDRLATNKNGCLRPADPMPSEPTRIPSKGEDGEDGEEEPLTDEWTVLDAPRAGTYRLAAPYRLPRGTPCPEQSQDD
ncbi:MFS transporter [Streptomyces sp. N2-109]|uniref:MFS transporter n=1 Tax=Streptomyces gossypii TaxID=2883101 RepID=A0ABT2JZ73_9ACTN|nr:MFS transporter [Streptomyces gossypii]MCT2593195.1 MFS transporter [Streptomyces gossypii]